METRNFFSVLSLIVKNSGMTLNTFFKSKNLLQRYSKTYIRRMFKEHFTTASAYKDLVNTFPQLTSLPKPTFTVRELPLRVGARRVKGKYVYRKPRIFGSMKGKIKIAGGPSDSPSLDEMYSAIAKNVPKKRRKTMRNLAKITDHALAKIGQPYTTAKEVLLMVASEIGYGTAVGIIQSERVKVKDAISSFDRG
jgi:hypothetical protein